MSIKMSFPLSHAQKGIWLGQQKMPDSPCYNTAEVLIFDGKIDIKKLIAATAHVLQSTAVLNMLFTHTDEGLVQTYLNNITVQHYSAIEPDFSLVTESTHVIQSPPSSTALNTKIYQFSDDKTLQAWQTHWLSQVLDLTNERPYRHAFIKQANGYYGWFLQIHHIACDGFSYGLIRNALKRAYESHVTFYPESEARKSLADFQALINTANAYELSEQRLRDHEYWQAHFAKHNPFSFKQTALSSVTPMAGLREYVPLPPKFLTSLKERSSCLKHDWPSLLKAMIAQWINHCTGETVITFGCPEMNRPFGPAMRIPALQMNILPITVTLSTQDSLMDIAKRIHTLHLSHKQHAIYRYENFSSLIKELKKQKSSPEISHTVPRKTFGPVINILPFERNLHIDDTKVSIKPIASGPVEDLAIYFVMNEWRGLDCFIEFHPELYNAEECRWLCENLSEWLNNAPSSQKDELTAPNPHVSMLSTPAYGNVNGINKTIFEQLEYQRVTHSKKEALRWLDESSNDPQWQSIDYQTLCTYIADTAQTFAQAGLHKEQKCIIATGRGPWSIISMFACLALNAEFIGIDIDGPSSRLQTIIDDCSPRLILLMRTDWLAEKNITLPADTVALTTGIIAQHACRSKISTATAMSIFCRNSSPHSPAYSIYTSGSTGVPKAVQVSQHALSSFIISANTVYEITAKDTVLQFSPLHFDACIEEIFISLCQGATLNIRTNNMVESFSDFNRAITELGITFLDLPTAFWHEWVRFNCFNQCAIPTSLSRVIIGGEACKNTAIAEFFTLDHEVKLINTYGPSETTVVATAKVLNRENWRSAHPATIGSPLPGRKVYILDEFLRPLPKGIAGQLAISGDSLSSGYFGQPDLTAKKFITRQYNQEPERVYLTGDIAAISSSDEVIFYGRVDDEIKISGQRIHPAEIAAALENVFKDHQLAVIPIKRENQYQIYAVAAHEKYGTWQVHTNLHELKQKLSETLPRVQIPSLVFEAPKLPLTSAGKIDRKKLQTIIDSHITQPATQINPNPDNAKTLATTLSQIIAIWKDVLGLTSIQPNDDFFVLGGTSLQLLQVATRLSETLQRRIAGTAITVSDLFKHPKAYKLAEAIDSGAQNQYLAETKKPVFTPPTLRSELKIKFREISNRRSSDYILLTGATGFVGIHILCTLLSLRGSVINVVCVIRAKTEIEARSKIKRTCESHNLMDISRSPALHIVLGDLAQNDWGLSHDDLLNLAKPLSAIIHNGAITSIVRDYQSLRPANVDATQTALKLAHLAGAPIHYISTIAVSDHTALPEDFVPLHHNLMDGYQQSKWASENLLQQRAEFGQPISIYRLPRVVGDPKIGTINSKDLIWQIAAASQRAGLLPNLAFDEPWLAVNEVANFIIARVFNQERGIYNCVPDHAVSIQALLQDISQISMLNQAPMNEWLNAVSRSTHSEDQALLAFFNGLQTHKGIGLPKINRENFIRSASKAALQAPHWQAYLNTALAQGLIRQAITKNPLNDLVTLENA